MNLRACLSDIAWLASPSRSIWISVSAIPRQSTSARMASVYVTYWSHPGQVLMYLQTLACPLNLAANALMGSSLSCFMWWRATRATITFSSRTARAYMAASTFSSVPPASVPPAFRVKSLLSCSSQHSSSCNTRSAWWPWCSLLTETGSTSIPRWSPLAKSRVFSLWQPG